MKKVLIFKLITVAILWISCNFSFAQTIINGSMVGTECAYTHTPVGWSPVVGYSGYQTPPTGTSPDILAARCPAYNNTAIVAGSASPDGGTWVGLNQGDKTPSENEAIQQTITGLTAGNFYKIQFYVANFGVFNSGNSWNNTGRMNCYLDGIKIASSSLRPVSTGWELVSGTFKATSNSAVIQLDPEDLSTSTDSHANYLSVDGVTIGPAAALTKSVNPSTISYGGTATYTFTINNNYTGSTTQNGLSFTDTLPAGLRIASIPNLQVTGLSGGTTTATSGGTSITASGYSIVSNSTATITVDVTNAAGQSNSSCGSNPSAFTNGASNISGLSSNLANNVGDICLIVNPCNAGSIAPTLN